MIDEERRHALVLYYMTLVMLKGNCFESESSSNIDCNSGCGLCDTSDTRLSDSMIVEKALERLDELMNDEDRVALYKLLVQKT